MFLVHGPVLCSCPVWTFYKCIDARYETLVVVRFYLQFVYIRGCIFFFLASRGNGRLCICIGWMQCARARWFIDICFGRWVMSCCCTVLACFMRKFYRNIPCSCCKSKYFFVRVLLPDWLDGITMYSVFSMQARFRGWRRGLDLIPSRVVMSQLTTVAHCSSVFTYCKTLIEFVAIDVEKQQSNCENTHTMVVIVPQSGWIGNSGGASLTRFTFPISSVWSKWLNQRSHA